MKTLTQKSLFNGWTAETVIHLETLPEGERIMEVTTLKRYGGKVVTMATVFIQKEQSKETVIFQDYNKTVAVYNVARLTEKSVNEAHAKSLEIIAPHIEAAKSQYGITI